jgi:hypothetical protein
MILIILTILVIHQVEVPIVLDLDDFGAEYNGVGWRSWMEEELKRTFWRATRYILSILLVSIAIDTIIFCPFPL